MTYNYLGNKRSLVSSSGDVCAILGPTPGVASNPERPESQANLADIAIGICLLLITILFLGRCYVRVFMKGAWVIEDYLVAIAWAGSVGYCALMRTVVSHHGGEHAWDITTSQAHEAFYWFNVTAIVYGPVIGVTKTALLVFYRRVFSPVRRSPFDIALIALMVIVLGFYISITIIKICKDPVVFGFLYGGFNSVSDFVILLLPVYAVSNLQITPSKRILVILGCTFGLCGPVFATVGFVVRLRIAGDKDATWNQYVCFLWAAAELATGILCVCFPEVAFMFRSRNYRGSGALARPSESQIQRGWNERVIKKPSDPYFSKSLMSTVFSNRGDQDYLELHDRQNTYSVEVFPTNHSKRGHEPGDDVIVLDSEITVERGDRRV